MASGGKQKDVKKSSYYVPSRYMQAAEKKSMQSHCSKDKSTFLKVSKDSRGESSQDSSSSLKLSVYQENRGMTSTPSSKCEFPFPSLDASAVTDRAGHLSVPALKEGIVSLGSISSDHMKRNLTKKNKFHNETHLSYGPVVASHKDRRKNDSFNQKAAEADVDLIYARCLQASFLKSEAQKALEKRSSCALESIHKLFNLVLLHMDKVKAQQSHLRITKGLISVQMHRQKQEDMLKPVFKIIPTLEEQYKRLAKTVYASKHKLHVKDVILPDAGSESVIVEQLQEINDVMCDFFQKFNNVKEICASADDLQNYVHTGEQILEAIKRGSDLLAEARDSVLSEASLLLSSDKS